jgi:hypothetical protein
MSISPFNISSVFAYYSFLLLVTLKSPESQSMVEVIRLLLGINSTEGRPMSTKGWKTDTCDVRSSTSGSFCRSQA